MGQDIELGCRCGSVRGVMRDASPRAVNRLVCYCADCQAFLHHLGRADLLDAQGGSDLVQAAPARVTYERGAADIAGVRLTPKGVFRWYAACCKTPLGNHVGPAVPFLGVMHEALRGAPDARRLDEAFGPPRGRVYGQFAIGEPPPGSTRPTARFLVGTVVHMLGWKLRGESWPHPFLDRATGAPRYPIATLAPAEREALRARCGPRPA